MLNKMKVDVNDVAIYGKVPSVVVESYNAQNLAWASEEEIAAMGPIEQSISIYFEVEIDDDSIPEDDEYEVIRNDAYQCSIFAISPYHKESYSLAVYDGVLKYERSLETEHKSV